VSDLILNDLIILNVGGILIAGSNDDGDGPEGGDLDAQGGGGLAGNGNNLLGGGGGGGGNVDGHPGAGCGTAAEINFILESGLGELLAGSDGHGKEVIGGLVRRNGGHVLEHGFINEITVD